MMKHILCYCSQVNSVLQLLRLDVSDRKDVKILLHIIFGNIPEAIYNTEMYFKNTYMPEWLLDSFAQEVVHKIDGSQILSANAIESPVLGVIPPTSLSGGVKTLLLIKNCPDKIFNASTCGDNCARFILALAETCDVTINLRHIMNFGKKRFTAIVENENCEVHNMNELLVVASRYV